MREIHKIAAAVKGNDKFFMVKKVGKNTWTSLGGKPEKGESEQEALLREIQEEIHCNAEIIKKLGDFKAPAVHDKAIVKLSVYLVKLLGKIKIDDPELERSMFIPKDYEKKNIKLPPSIEKQVLPYCIREGLLNW